MIKFCLLILACGSFACAQNSSETMTNETIARMVYAGVPTDTIIKTIQVAEPVHFALSPADLAALEQAKVPEDVVKAMAARMKGPAISLPTPTVPPKPQPQSQIPVPMASPPRAPGSLGKARERGRRNWQTGLVLDTASSTVYLGTTSNTMTNGTVSASSDGVGNAWGTYSGYSTTSQRERHAVREVEVIDGGQYVYVVARVRVWRWNKPAYLTINAPVEFAIEKHSMYILDDDGREYKTAIVKQTLKMPVEASPGETKLK